MITFNEVSVIGCDINYHDVETWINVVISDQNKNLDCINFVFCSDDYLLDVNNKYLNHDYYTDVITFDYGRDIILSDVFISVDRVKDNASVLGVMYFQELLRVMVHAVLHLCGFVDKTDDEEMLMRTMEDKYLALFVSRET